MYGIILFTIAQYSYSSPPPTDFPIGQTKNVLFKFYVHIRPLNNGLSTHLYCTLFNQIMFLLTVHNKYFDGQWSPINVDNAYITYSRYILITHKYERYHYSDLWAHNIMSRVRISWTKHTTNYICNRQVWHAYCTLV